MQPFQPQLLPRQDLDWAGLLPVIGEANRAVARFDGILHGLPNPGVLLAPLVTQEAVLSSRIEGTRATVGEVLRFEAGEAQVATEAEQEDIREVLSYRSALQHAQEELVNRPLSLNLLRELHAMLLDSVRGRNRARGEFRRVQNWIGPAGAPIERAAFVPAAPDRVHGLLDNWEKYYHSDERDPLVQLAILHAQFEIIHPFLDGNGRLGRMVIPLFLYERRILARPVFYLSAYLESHRDGYVAGLRALNGGNTWTQWVRFFLEAVVAQASAHATTARDIMQLHERLKADFIEVTHSRYAVLLLDRLFARPIVSSTDLVNQPGMPSKPMVMRLLNRLRDAGILTVVREGRGRQAQVLGLKQLVDLVEPMRTQRRNPD